MPTEKKITENPATVAPSKPKRRFKLDKKHIQGFIAGILVAAIAFTGLYYGTEGRFFKGEMYLNYTYVTDATFEDEVLKSKIPVLVIFYASGSEQSRKLHGQILDIALYYEHIAEFAFADARNVPGVTRQYVVNNVPTFCIFKGGKIVSRKEGLLTKNELWELLEEEVFDKLK